MPRHAILDVFERITTRAPFMRPKALELFCGEGLGQAIQYAPFCEYLEGWDMRDDKINAFLANIPQARAHKCDIYTEIFVPRPAGEVKKFDMIAVDNSFLIARNNHFEHFDLLPGLLNLMNPATCFVVFTVCPDPFSYAEPRKQALLDAFGANVEDFLRDWDKARDRFYGLPGLSSDNIPKIPPVSAIKLDSMEQIYREKFEGYGWKVPYTFSMMRGRAAGYVLIEAKQDPVEVASKKVETSLAYYGEKPGSKTKTGKRSKQ